MRARAAECSALFDLPSHGLLRGNRLTVDGNLDRRPIEVVAYKTMGPTSQVVADDGTNILVRAFALKDKQQRERDKCPPSKSFII